MSPDDLLAATPTILAVLSGACAGLAIATKRNADRVIRRAEALAARYDAAIELQAEAHDPGREVHYRLAAAMEAEMVLSGDGPPRPDPAARRAAAMFAAGAIIGTAQRANLNIVPAEPPLEED